MLVRVCNRCGTEISGNIFTSVDVTISRIMSSGENFDLCETCRNELINFLNSEEWIVGERKENLEKVIKEHYL